METNSWLDELLAARGLSRESLKHRKVSGKHRHKIAQDIGADWEILATFIGVPPQEVDDIKEEHTRPLNRRFVLMRKWHQLYGSDATYLKLINGLIQAGRRDLIESLLQANVGALTGSQVAEHGIAPTNDGTDEPALQAMITADFLCRLIIINLSIFMVFTVLTAFIGHLLQLPTVPSAWKGLTEMTGITDLQSSNQPSLHMDMGIQPGKFIQPSDGGNNFKSCDPPVSDLPIIDNEIFVGRENDISMVVNMMASAHIININGAPGIGKSTLAIHVGYEMIRNGNSVRYINMGEKLSSLFKNNMNSNKGVRHIMAAEQSNETKLVIDISTVSLSLWWNYDSNESTVHAENFNFVQELKKWSSGISCPTVLILDNCDDILVSSSRDEFISLIYSLLNQSKFNLHIIIVSMEKLILLNNFNHWIVANLDLSDSVHFLDQLVTPEIDASYLAAVAELVERNPLALKIVGKLLDLHGEHLVHDLKIQLNQNPLNVLDEASIQKEKFRSVLDMAFARLGQLKECGYILGLFPGSFDKNASVHVISAECFEVYKRYSLLDEYHLAHHYRYKMHRLIKEYVKEKLNKDEESTFNDLFIEHYEQILLAYAIKSILNNGEIYSLSLEAHNFNRLKVLLLQYKHFQLSAKQLAVLGFLFSQKNYLKLEALHMYFSMYMNKLNDICQLLSPATCGGLYMYIVKHSYQNCKCETLAEYVQNIFHCPCENIFNCTVINQITDLCSDTRYDNNMLCAQLPYQEKMFINAIGETCHYCDGSWYKNFILCFFTTFLTSILLLVFSLCLTKQYIRNLLWTFIFFSPLYYIIMIVIGSVVFQAFDIASVLHLFTKLNASNPLLIQIVSRKLCISITAILFWCIVLVCMQIVDRKFIKELHICILIFLYGCAYIICLLMVVAMCKFQLILCQFLPICL